MNLTKSQWASIALLNLSFLIEIVHAGQWIDLPSSTTILGLSLGLVLLSMSLNVKTIRRMGIDKKEKDASVKLLLIAAVYTFLVYALQIPQAIFAQ